MLIQARPANQGDDIAVASLISEYAAAFEFELGEQDVVGEGMKAREYYDAGGLFVADDDGDIVGCVAYEPWGDGRCRMKRMYVLEDYRGKGIGKALAQMTMDEAKKMGFKEMCLDTTQGMVEARGLYKSLGFKEWEPDYEAPCRGTIYMRRDL